MAMPDRIYKKTKNNIADDTSSTTCGMQLKCIPQVLNEPGREHHLRSQ